MDDVIMPRRKEIVGDKKYVSISLHADLVRKVDEVIDRGEGLRHQGRGSQGRH